MKLHVGTSGYSYKEWKGNFYPEDLPAKEMLSYYSRRLPAVEINNTFYRLPQATMIEKWRAQVPEEFRFSIKATQRITHIKRLNNVAEETKYLLDTSGLLGERLGVVLFQLPPNMKKDSGRLKSFLELLPSDARAAFEFRNESWFAEDNYDALRAAGASLCLSEREDNAPPPLVETAAWGYVRLRLEQYSDADLEQWARRLAHTAWKEIYVYFMHEPTAPAYAQMLMRFATPASPPSRE